ncbi:MAG TPA: MFS transporter [Candidatus Merdivicinus faecavium]|nr:MFS transporter [Candidatus Merdivicinus faecavium]
MQNGYKRLKYACYTTNLSMSVISALQPLLFLTFRERYGISYSLLGLLVLVNYCTQLAIDLVFSFYSHKFNIEKTVRLIPVITAVGLFVYALAPVLFPNAVYGGLMLGAVIFAASGGLSEVLISPVIAAIPADNPDREMSKLHSIFAWGVVGVVIVSTVFLTLAGTERWQLLAILWMLVPMAAAFLYHGQKLPAMERPEKSSGALRLALRKDSLLSFFCIFAAGASECSMSQWSSSYLEQALGIPKAFGDIFGVALFSVMLGLGRSLYAKYGKQIGGVLFFGSVGALVCYLTAAFSSVPLIGLLACALTGFCVSMLWPGNLIAATARIPGGGVALFALMAAGGDLGGSVGPQLIGLVADAAMENERLLNWAAGLGLTADQLGMKAGLLVAAVFPLLGVFLCGILWKKLRAGSKSN